LVIAKDTVVSLDVELSDIWGKLIQRSEEPLQYLHGGYGNIFPAAEAPPSKASASRTASKCVSSPRMLSATTTKIFSESSRAAAFPGSSKSECASRALRTATTKGLIFTVTDIAEDKVVLDANHALAGMALKFSCTVVAVRPATEAEIQSSAADDPQSVILRILP
jgi:FKBP-type peptidyl-prolyl cis-trans isomerase SlyD